MTGFLVWAGADYECNTLTAWLMNFQGGGSITFADFLAAGTDVEFLFNNAVFLGGQSQDVNDKVISEGETITVTGVTGTDVTSALDVVFV